MNRTTETDYIKGTINFNGEDYDYSARVSFEVSSWNEYHGFPYSPESMSETEVSDIEILEVTPEPNDSIVEKVYDLIDEKVFEKY